MNRSRYLGALAALALAAGGVTAQGLAAQGATVAGAGAIDPIAPVHEIPASVDTSLVNETKGSWFVELESEPASAGTDSKTLTAERQEFRAAAKDADVDYSVRRTFHTGESRSPPGAHIAPEASDICGGRSPARKISPL